MREGAYAADRFNQGAVEVTKARAQDTQASLRRAEQRATSCNYY